jgi:hypothetical protein
MQRNKCSVDLRFLEMSYRKQAELAELLEELREPEKLHPQPPAIQGVCDKV